MTGTEVIEANPFLPDNLPARKVDVDAEVAEARAKAESIQVTNQEEAKAALDLSKELNRQMKAIEDERVSLTKPRKDAAEEIKRRFDEMKAGHAAVDKIVRGKLSSYQAEEKRKAEERQRKAEEERQRVEAEARAKREAAEKAEREAEQMRREEQDAEDAKAAAELAAEARRDAERAQVTEQAIQSLPPDAPAAAPALSGFSERTKREAFVVDRAKLPDTLPDGTPLVVVDMVALRRWMDLQWTATGNAPELPGAEFKRVPAGTSVRT